MGISRLSVLIMRSRDDIFIETVGKRDNWGFWVTYGARRDLLVSSPLAYTTQQSAKDAGDALVKSAKTDDWIAD